jgi:hypothetical protein
LQHMHAHGPCVVELAKLISHGSRPFVLTAVARDQVEEGLPSTSGNRTSYRPARMPVTNHSASYNRPNYISVDDNQWADKVTSAKLKDMLLTEYPTVLLNPRGGPSSQYTCLKLMVRAAQLIDKQAPDKQLVFFVIRLR